MKIYSIKDIKVGAFLKPMCEQHVEVCIRGIKGAMENPETMLAKFPSDFALYELGEFNDEIGEIIPCTPKHIINVQDLAPSVSSQLRKASNND